MYAQDGEDDILARFFGEQADGCFVDVGAMDGVTYSNTYLFEQRGWHGLCIEPNPKTFHRCQQRRKANCLWAAIVGSSEPREVTLYLSGMDELATLTTAHEADIARIHGNVGLPFNGFAPITVPAMTLDDAIMMHMAGTIDLLSIDTEWTNADVLKGFTLSLWQPRVVVIEVGDGVEAGMSDYFFIGKVGANLIYVRDGDDVKAMSKAVHGYA